MAAIALSRWALCVAVISFAGCDRPENGSQEHGARAATDSLPPSASPTSQNVAIRSGPRLTTDSLASEARLEIRAGEYVVHLPTPMARILNDSFPGFAPISRTAYDKEFLAAIESKSEPRLLSIVLGDFNGDSKQDVAMLGHSENRELTVMVLAATAGQGQSRLFVVSRGGDAAKGEPGYYLNLVRPQRIRANAELESDELVLRTDAVQVVVPEKASSIFFLDNGVIREYTTSD